MKRLYLLLITLAAAWSASANPVSEESAQQKATKFILGNKALARGQHKIKLASASEAYYVFNIEDNGGYVIVSGDDAAPDILGYSKNGSFDNRNMPENMRSFLGSLEEQILAIQTRGIKTAPQKTVSGGAIAPLLGNIAFEQGEPYNQKCPDWNSSTKCVTGCVAVAMAQVMRYWKYPDQTTKEIPTYTLNYTNGTSKTFQGWDITAIDWTNMLPSYRGNESTTQIDAVATLLSLCGTSVRMNYGPSGSGASSGDIPNALKTYFNYDAGTRAIERLDYRAAEWNQTIYNELQQERPVIYSGQSSGAGHTFVVDGYDCDDFFHINWGWGGNQDDYFLLSVVDPGANAGIGASSSSDGYGFGQDAIIGIQPSTGNEYKETVALTTSRFNAYQTLGEVPQKSFTITRTSSAQNFTISIASDRRNRLSDIYTIDVGVGAFNSQGDLVTSQILFYWEDLGYGAGNSLNNTFTFGANLSDGTYTIAPISRKRGTTEWIKDYGADNYYITATISGNTLTIKNVSTDLSGTIKASGKTEVNSTLPLEVTITNNGTFFNNEVFLFVNGKNKGGRVIEIEAGSSMTDSFSFLPEVIGTYDVSIVYISYNSSHEAIYNTIASTSVTVNEAKSTKLSGVITMSNLEDAYTIKGSSMKFTLKVSNLLDEEYDNNIVARIWNNTEGDYYNLLRQIDKPVKIAGNGSADIDFQIDGLEIGVRHWLEILYYSEGKLTEMEGCSIVYHLIEAGNIPCGSGDANGDGTVDVKDIAAIVNYLMGNNTGFNADEADVNGDGTVNAADIVKIVNMIMGN